MSLGHVWPSQTNCMHDTGLLHVRAIPLPPEIEHTPYAAACFCVPPRGSALAFWTAHPPHVSALAFPCTMKEL